MSKPDDLFPFPQSDSNEKPDDQNAQDSTLPSFPGSDFEMPLTSEELHDLRKMLAGFRSAQTQTQQSPVQAPEEQPAASVGSETIPAARVEKEDGFASIWNLFNGSDPVESAALTSIKELMQEITNEDDLFKVLLSFAGIFPLRKFLRHGTPDQKLFAMNVLGDRFLQGLAGFNHPVRKKLLKMVGRYFSGVAENYSFIVMESEPFNVLYHERVAGASASGRVVREMHGFLVVTKDSNKVVRLGQVLT